MKRLLSVGLAVAIMLAAGGCGAKEQPAPVGVTTAKTSAEALETGKEKAGESEKTSQEKRNVKGVIGVTQVMDVFHQITAVIIDYGVEVEAPGTEAYHIVDYDTADLREKTDKREYSEGVITNVYANSSPATLEDPLKAPSSGRYVVVELEPAHSVEFVAEDAYGENCDHRPVTATGICTWRKEGDSSDWRRTDFSKFVVEQTEPVVSKDQTVVFEDGQLPSMKYEELINIGLDEFVTTTLESSRKTPIHYSYHHPDESRKDEKFPMMVWVTGGGGRLDFDEVGNPISIGGNLSRERVPIAWMDMDENLIVVAVQAARDNAPYHENYDEVEDTAELIQYFIDHMGADPDRIYCMGSSYGTMHLSKFLQKHADMIAAYVQCNGHFEGAQTIYTEEGDKNFVDYTDASLLNPDPESYMPEAREALKGVVENHIPIWVWHGVNDETAPVTRGVSTVEILKKLYTEQGLDQETIDELAKIYLIEDEEYHSYGIVERHNSSRVAVKHPEFMEWVLQQSRTKNAEIGK